jgi:hypothetical protein
MDKRKKQLRNTLILFVILYIIYKLYMMWCNAKVNTGINIGMRKGIKRGLKRGLVKGMSKGIEVGIKSGIHMGSLEESKACDMRCDMRLYDYNTKAPIIKLDRIFQTDTQTSKQNMILQLNESRKDLCSIDDEDKLIENIKNMEIVIYGHIQKWCGMGEVDDSDIEKLESDIQRMTPMIVRRLTDNQISKLLDYIKDLYIRNKQIMCENDSKDKRSKKDLLYTYIRDMVIGVCKQTYDKNVLLSLPVESIPQLIDIIDTDGIVVERLNQGKLSSSMNAIDSFLMGNQRNRPIDMSVRNLGVMREPTHKREMGIFSI